MILEEGITGVTLSISFVNLEVGSDVKLFKPKESTKKLFKLLGLNTNRPSIC